MIPFSTFFFLRGKTKIVYYIIFVAAKRQNLSVVKITHKSIHNISNDKRIGKNIRNVERKMLRFCLVNLRIYLLHTD